MSSTKTNKPPVKPGNLRAAAVRAAREKLLAPRNNNIMPPAVPSNSLTASKVTKKKSDGGSRKTRKSKKSRESKKTRKL